MGLRERIIAVFEDRVKKLVRISNICELPRWTDADVIAADCLLKQYRNLTHQSSGGDKAEALHCPICGKPDCENLIGG